MSRKAAFLLAALLPLAGQDKYELNTITPTSRAELPPEVAISSLKYKGTRAYTTQYPKERFRNAVFEMTSPAVQSGSADVEISCIHLEILTEQKLLDYMSINSGIYWEKDKPKVHTTKYSYANAAAGAQAINEIPKAKPDCAVPVAATEQMTLVFVE